MFWGGGGGGYRNVMRGRGSICCTRLCVDALYEVVFSFTANTFHGVQGDHVGISHSVHVYLQYMLTCMCAYVCAFICVCACVCVLLIIVSITTLIGICKCSIKHG